MNDESMSAQAAEAQDTQAEATNYSGGNAMLNAEIEAGEQMSSNPVFDEPITTDLASNTDSD